MIVEEEILNLKGKVKMLELKLDALIKALAKEGVIVKKDIELELKDMVEK